MTDDPMTNGANAAHFVDCMARALHGYVAAEDEAMKNALLALPADDLLLGVGLVLTGMSTFVATKLCADPDDVLRWLLKGATDTFADAVASEVRRRS